MRRVALDKPVGALSNPMSTLAREMTRTRDVTVSTQCRDEVARAKRYHLALSFLTGAQSTALPGRLSPRLLGPRRL